VQDKEFFSMALGLKEPWKVKDVQMDMGAQRVTIIVECRCGATWADEGGLLTVHGYEERQWRHLDTMQFETIISARVPRVRRPDGSTEMVQVPWAQSRTRWTLMFEGVAVRVLQNSRSIAQACELLRLDWSSAHRIMERAVERGLERRSLEEVEYIGMDEKNFKRGQSYVSIMVDLNRKAPRVLEVATGRDIHAAKELLNSLPEATKEKVKAVAIDMSASYDLAVRETLPKADIVHDRFHVSKLLGEAVDKVRRGEHKELLQKGDKRLLGTRYIWLYHPNELDTDRLKQLDELFEVDHLRTARAYYHRLRFIDFWNQADINEGQRFFARWFHEAMQSCLQPVKKVAHTLQAHLEGLLTYFQHKITNAMSECFNSTIQSIKASARGFRNFDNYRIRILFFLGRLDLQPR
jgi:transposase